MEHFILQMFSDRVWEYLFNKFGYGYLMYRKYKEIKDWPWYDNIIFNRTYTRTCYRISYINKMLFNLSVSYADRSFAKESLYFASLVPIGHNM